MPIHEIVSSGNIVELLSEIRKNPLCIYSLNKNKQSPLHIAAFLGHSKIIHILLLQAKKNYDEKVSVVTVSGYINRYDIIEHDAVISALINGHVQCFKKLLALSCIDQTNKSNQTILNYILLEAANNEIKQKFNPRDIIEFLLQQGANPTHHDKSPIGTYLNYIKALKLPLDYWHIFLNYGVGICFDFAILGFNPSKKEDVELLEKITANKVVLGNWKGKIITRELPGFSNAITNLEQLKEYINSGHTLNFKSLLSRIRVYLDLNSKNTIKPVIMHPELVQIAQYMGSYVVPSLKEIVTKQIKFFQDNIPKVDKDVKKLTPDQLVGLYYLPVELKEFLINNGVNAFLAPTNADVPSKKST